MEKKPEPTMKTVNTLHQMREATEAFLQAPVYNFKRKELLELREIIIYLIECANVEKFGLPETITYFREFVRLKALAHDPHKTNTNITHDGN